MLDIGRYSECNEVVRWTEAKRLGVDCQFGFSRSFVPVDRLAVEDCVTEP